MFFAALCVEDCPGTNAKTWHATSGGDFSTDYRDLVCDYHVVQLPKNFIDGAAVLESGDCFVPYKTKKVFKHCSANVASDPATIAAWSYSVPDGYVG